MQETEASLKYKEYRAKAHAAVAEARVWGLKAFYEAGKHLFVEHPALIKFGWAQYTPYFCDGDPCVFGANVDEPMVHTVDASGKTENDDYFYLGGKRVNGVYIDNEPTSEHQKAGAAIIKFLRTFDQDDLKEWFGDHMKITVSKSGVETTEYEHE